LGHVGDGNFHSFLLFDPTKPDEYKKAEALASRMAKYNPLLKMGNSNSI